MLQEPPVSARLAETTLFTGLCRPILVGSDIGCCAHDVTSVRNVVVTSDRCFLATSRGFANTIAIRSFEDRAANEACVVFAVHTVGIADTDPCNSAFTNVVSVAGTAIIPVAAAETQACTGLVGTTISIGHTITEVVAIVLNAFQISVLRDFTATLGVTETVDGSRIADGSSAISASRASAVPIIVVR